MGVIWRKIIKKKEEISLFFIRLEKVEEQYLMAQEKIMMLEQQNKQRSRENRELTSAIGVLQNELQKTNMLIRDEGIDSVLEDENKLKQLNLQLSIHPTIWGDEQRLHISDTAAVRSSFFNTNSGEITIGNYTFTGSGVSFLTGSHDARLTGLLRRDCEIKSGRDIVVGNGVWIGSNATIIGPCSIGDNAVIAAGAVVTPGTKISANAVYAGVPAKHLKTLDIEEENSAQNPCVLEDLHREGNILFLDGWSEKKYITRDKKTYMGHWLLAENGYIYIMHGDKKMSYVAEGNMACNIMVDGDVINLDAAIGEINFKSARSDKINRIEVKKLNSKSDIFIGELIDNA